MRTGIDCSWEYLGKQVAETSKTTDHEKDDACVFKLPNDTKGHYLDPIYSIPKPCVEVRVLPGRPCHFSQFLGQTNAQNDISNRP